MNLERAVGREYSDRPVTPFILSEKDWKELRDRDSTHPFQKGDQVMAKFTPIPARGNRRVLVTDDKTRTIERVETRSGKIFTIYFENEPGEFDACYFKKVEASQK